MKPSPQLLRDTQARDGASVPVSDGDRLRILSISCVYPNPSDRNYGRFVERRLGALSARADVRVIAPTPLIDWSRYKFVRRSEVPAVERNTGPEVYHPRWIYAPGGWFVNPLFLFVRLLPTVLRLRRSFPFDLIDSHFAYPDGIAAGLLAAVLNLPFTITLRGNETMHAGHPFRRRLISWAIRRATAVIAVSAPLCRFAMEMGAGASRVHLIPNGIEGATFYPRDRERCRRKWDISAQAQVILSAGSLIERKGHHRAIEAVAALKSGNRSVQLLIAGGTGREGSYEKQLRQRVIDLQLGEAVRFVGPVNPDEMAELMNAADVLCLSSTREGWPNVVHESLACGTPVVATSVGSVPEMLAGSGFGFVVPPNDPGALADALRSALNCSWDHAAIAAWGGARSWDNVGQDALATYVSCLTSLTPPPAKLDYTAPQS